MKFLKSFESIVTDHEFTTEIVYPIIERLQDIRDKSTYGPVRRFVHNIYDSPTILRIEISSNLSYISLSNIIVLDEILQSYYNRICKKYSTQVWIVAPWRYSDGSGPVSIIAFKQNIKNISDKYRIIKRFK